MNLGSFAPYRHFIHGNAVAEQLPVEPHALLGIDLFNAEVGEVDRRLLRLLSEHGVGQLIDERARRAAVKGDMMYREMQSKAVRQNVDRRADRDIRVQVKRRVIVIGDLLDLFKGSCLFLLNHGEVA